jgi:hypothetical protein
MEPGQRCCQECGEIYPESVDNFPAAEDGSLSVSCVKCVGRKRRDRGLKKSAKRAGMMKKMEKVAVDALLENAVRGGANIPHSAELLEQIMTYWGGTSGFSALLVKQYFDSKPGSSQRGKMLEMVVRLVQKNVDQGGAQKPLTLWSEEELDLELKDRFRRAILEGRTVDDEEGEAAAGDTLAIGSETHLPVRDGADACLARGVGGSADRGTETLSAYSAAGGDARLSGE